jgi:hypothetical protein
MPLDDERLLVSLEARIRDFERNMAKAQKVANRDFGGIEKRAKQSASRLESSLGSVGAKAAASMRTLALSFAGGFAAGGLAELTRGFGKMVKGIAEIGDAAKRSGLSAQSFQEWKFVAEQNRVGIDAVVDGFKELNLRADEWIATGGGPAAEAFQRLGFTADQLKTRLKDPSALMLEIVGRLQSLDKAAQIRIADELFGGTGGEQFVQLIDQGEAGLRRTIARAHELGSVLDAQVIQKAAELDRKWSELSTRAGNTFRGVVIDLAEMVGLLRQAREAMPYDSGRTRQVLGPEVARELDKLPLVSDQSRRLIDETGQEYNHLANEARGLVLALSDASSMMAGLGNTGAASALTELASRMQEAVQEFEAGKTSGDEMRAVLIEVGTEIQTTVSGFGELDAARLSGVTSAVGGLLSAIAQVPAMVAQAVNSVRQLDNLPAAGITSHAARAEETTGAPGAPTFAPSTSARPRTAPALLGEPELPEIKTHSGGGGGGGGSSGPDAYQRATEGIRDRIAAAQAETVARQAATGSIEAQEAAVDRAKVAFDLLQAAQEAGMAITPELTSEAHTMAGALIEAEQAARKLADAQREIANRQEAVKDSAKEAFTGLLTGSTSALEALQNLVNRLAELAASDLFDQLFAGAASGATGGGLGSMLRGLLSFDGGGFTGRGPRSGGLDGKGGKLALVHPNETVLDHVKGGTTRGLAMPRNMGSIANTYAPNVSISMQGSGNPTQDAQLAKLVAKEVGKHVSPPDGFRRNQRQENARLAMRIMDGKRNM